MSRQIEPIFVIIPCYNEHEVLADLLNQLTATPYEIVLIDDGSDPHLYTFVENRGIHYLRHEINLGQGAALQTGMTYALRQGAEILVHFDADGQHQVADIVEMIRPIQASRYQVVLGSRFLRATDRRSVPILRRVLLQGARLVNKLLTGLWLSDAHNGFRALSRDAASRIYLSENRMAHATELLFQIKKNQLSYCECPTHIAYSAYSKQKGQPWWNALNIVLDTLINKSL